MSTRAEHAAGHIRADLRANGVVIATRACVARGTQKSAQ